jgi:hypothetical protein
MPITPVDPNDRITPWIVYWIVLPVIALALVGAVVSLTWSSWRCQHLAADRGYMTGTYFPPNRSGAGEACICKGKRNPDGTVDPSVLLVIELR